MESFKTLLWKPLGKNMLAPSPVQVHPSRVGGSIEKTRDILCIVAEQMYEYSYTEKPPNCVGGIREFICAY